MTTNYIPLDIAKKMIVKGLHRFDPELANRAAHILYNKERVNIVEVTEPRTNMMMCRPAGITVEDLKAQDMHIPDFAEKFGPHFTHQDNPTDHAIIDFEYDGTSRSIVWLAHELGHALADDVQRENGHGFKDFSPGEMEEQAYFIQHIVSRYLKDTMSMEDAHPKNLGEDVLRMSWERANQFTNAGKVYQEAMVSAPGDRKQRAIRALDQRQV